MFGSDSIMNWNCAIPYVPNTLKKIYLSKTILNEFTSTYSYDNNDYFEMLFQQYTDFSDKKIKPILKWIVEI